MVRYYSIAVLLLLSFPHFVQAGGSVYGANGLGETLVAGGARVIGLGGGGLALADSHGANFSNPALLALVPGAQVRLGGHLAYWSTKSGGITDADAEIEWQSFYLAFPLTSAWKVGFGLLPVRRMDVRTFGWQELANQSYEERIRFYGGEAEAQFVSGLTISPHFSAGLAIGYAFRRSERWTTVDFVSSDWQDAEFHFDDTWRGWAVTLGALYEVHPKLSLGLIFRPRQQGNWVTRFSYINQDSVAELEESGEGPGEWGVGIAWKVAEGWMLVGDGRSGLWKTGDLGPRDPRTPVSPLWLSAGVERLARSETHGSPLQKWGYRAGIFYRQQHWPEQNGEKVVDLGGAVGLSVPAPAQRGAIHLAAEVGRRGSEKFGALETFTRFTLMIELNEQWFQRPKPRIPQ